MITDADVKKLATVFATKDDIQGLSERLTSVENRMATKEDLREMESGIRRDMATKEDLREMESGIRQDMATKNDLKLFATKDDLKSFATKEDLKRFATKEDLKQFATKEYLENALEYALDRHTAGIVNGVRTIIDMLGDTSDKTDINHEEVKRQRIILGDHEKRITVLEHKPA